LGILALNLFKVLNVKKPVSLLSKINSAPKELIDLLSKILVFNPKHRLTADEILKHPYFKAFHCKDNQNPRIAAFPLISETSAKR